MKALTSTFPKVSTPLSVVAETPTRSDVAEAALGNIAKMGIGIIAAPQAAANLTNQPVAPAA